MHTYKYIHQLKDINVLRDPNNIKQCQTLQVQLRLVIKSLQDMNQNIRVLGRGNGENGCRRYGYQIAVRGFDSPEKAARAFDAAAFCLRGSSAKFNFPDQPPNIPGGRSLSPSEIQAAATHYANLPHSYPNHYFESPPGSVADIAGPTETYNSRSSSSFLLEDNESHVTDYGIFPGFDDYFMRPPPIDSPQYTAYEEENSSYGDISQGPSFLWNF